MRLFYLFLILPLFSISQKNAPCLPIQSFDPNFENVEDLQQLDSLFKTKRLIGVGESTHGTSEFTTMRFRIFKYLVEYHEFNTFFLEADAVACLNVNRFIHGKYDSLDQAIIDLSLWPWATQEMKNLVMWMKEYNLSNQNTLNFIGCDAQLSRDFQNEIHQNFRNINPGFEELLNLMDTTQFTLEKDSAKFQKFISIWNILDATISKSVNSELNQNDYAILRKDIQQWIYFKTETNFKIKANFRDSIMAQNISDFLSDNPTFKGLYFAHNGHVSKRNEYHKRPDFYTKKAGFYLDKVFGYKYFAIAQDFYSGIFNAIDLVEGKPVMKEFYEESEGKNEIPTI